MNSLLGFILENTIKNSAPIFAAAIITALVGGKLLTSLGLAWFVRVVAYSLSGAAAGLWSYSAYDIPGRSIELLEALTLGLGMLLYCSVVVGIVTFVREQNRVEEDADSR